MIKTTTGHFEGTEGSFHVLMHLGGLTSSASFCPGTYLLIYAMSHEFPSNHAGCVSLELKDARDYASLPQTLFCAKMMVLLDVVAQMKNHIEE